MDEDEMSFDELRARMNDATAVAPMSGPRPVLAAASAGTAILQTAGLKVQILDSTFFQVTVTPSSRGYDAFSPTPSSLSAAKPVLERTPR